MPVIDAVTLPRITRAAIPGQTPPDNTRPRTVGIGGLAVRGQR
jgi:hypothetical protein